MYRVIQLGGSVVPIPRTAAAIEASNVGFGIHLDLSA